VRFAFLVGQLERRLLYLPRLASLPLAVCVVRPPQAAFRHGLDLLRYASAWRELLRWSATQITRPANRLDF
jgi:hypothetical protein